MGRIKRLFDKFKHNKNNADDRGQNNNFEHNRSQNSNKKVMVSPARFERATYALGGRRAIQLCHGDNAARL
jgi:hypothetical protein